MTEGRYEEALKILKDGAKTNKRTLPPDSEVLEMLKTLHDEVHLLSAVARALLFTLAAVECALKKCQLSTSKLKGSYIIGLSLIYIYPLGRGREYCRGYREDYKGKCL
jgi:hypothetical protein